MKKDTINNLAKICPRSKINVEEKGMKKKKSESWAEEMSFDAFQAVSVIILSIWKHQKKSGKTRQHT